MYVLGGFDGTRLNDMHMIAFPVKRKLQQRPMSTLTDVTQTDNFDETEASIHNLTEIEDESTPDVKHLKKQVRMLK